MPDPLLRLAHSPDSDDLVMWWPLTGMRTPVGDPVPGELGTPRIDAAGFRFETVPVDVETLNQGVVRGGPRGDTGFDITAISAAVYPEIQNEWVITRCGGSFGEGYGPRVVVREDSPVRTTEDLRGQRIAVPGMRTSAYLTLSLLLGEGRSRGFEPEAMLFSAVPAAVADGRAEAGLLIHEAQLTYASLGLRMVVDLGAWWTGVTGLPLPLGLNVLRRDLDARIGEGTCRRVGNVLRSSVRYAIEHPEESRRYLLLHSEGRPEWRDPALVDRYLSMYVSRMSLDLGEAGASALNRFFHKGADRGYIGPVAAVEAI